MITFLLIVGLIISLGINISTFKLIQILLRKISIYEQWIVTTKGRAEEILASMRNIDKQGIRATSVNDKGLFESDDQVGHVFKDLEDLIKELNEKIE
jgi:hypothetical protein